MKVTQRSTFRELLRPQRTFMVAIAVFLSLWTVLFAALTLGATAWAAGWCWQGAVVRWRTAVGS